MPTTAAAEYRQFAQESLKWAAEADTDDFRQACLDIARDWTFAAMKLENVVIPEAILHQKQQA
jgi:hypothetical protein